ncbi:MAG: AraC family transcriptional regulator [Clostridiales bacterium]|nr:AraC family transcriptional regulator [Clostridiales bacterium]
MTLALTTRAPHVGGGQAGPAALYAETHLAEKITLEGAAQSLLVSQSALQQTFRDKLGVSFYRFVTQRRLIAAKNLILEGQPLTSVGEQVGFSDYSTFYRAFQKEYGVSPSQFRKRNRPANG